MTQADSEVVGLVPAAGRGKRLAPLPCSKELYPIGFRQDARGELRSEVVSDHLFEKFRRAGLTRAYVIVREGKWDIPAYFGDGRNIGLNVAYLVIKDSIGPPDTLDRAFAFVARQSVAFGFPDILFGPDDVFERLLRHQDDTNADIVLGCYPAHDVRQVDMLELEEGGRVRSIALKPPSSTLRFTWICAVWTAAFSEFMHNFVRGERSTTVLDTAAYRDIDSQGDLPVGAVIKSAIENGLRVYGVTFPDEPYVDIGTPENLIEALRKRATAPA